MRYLHRMNESPEMKELAGIAARLAKIEKERDQLRERALTLSLIALKDGVAPSEVSDLSPYSPAHLRKLAREQGIPAAPPGIKPKRKIEL
jgi:uncharacterized protein